ncbi:MAG: hypothetical protein PWQ66_1119, partial [Petrotoga sp.]|nr:hypothetical protein [Petrotoga sp.]
MKVLFITNLLPFSHNPARGIFITNRLKTMQSFDMNFDVYGIISKDSFGIKLLKKILSIPSVNSTDSFYEVDGVKYKYAFFSRSLGDVFNSRVLKKNNQI